MSEYQYYEWQTLDRPLTVEGRPAVSRRFSKRPALRERLQRARLLRRWHD